MDFIGTGPYDFLMKIALFSLILIVAGAGCRNKSAADVTVTDRVDSSFFETAEAKELRKELRAVTVEDGISAAEAEIIAKTYFAINVGCGGFTGIRDGGEFWIVDGAFGDAATPIKGFHIAKSTGKITSPIGPSYATPFAMIP